MAVELYRGVVPWGCTVGLAGLPSKPPVGLSGMMFTWHLPRSGCSKRPSLWATAGSSFTPAMSAHSKVIRRCLASTYAPHASINSSRGYLRLMGMMALRAKSLASWSETASVNCSGSSASWRMRGARPTVEMVMCRAPMPSSLLMRRHAAKTD